jgi:hypothetical protein
MFQPLGAEMADQEKYRVVIKGPGLTFDQPVDRAATNRIISFVMTGSTLPERGGLGGEEGAAGASGGSAAGTSNLKPKEFIARKKPSTQYERIACLAHYLAIERKVTEFGAKEIAAVNKEAAQQPISNLAQIMGDTARKYGYLSAAGGGKKQITAVGEEVVKALPDRQAVKAALVEYRPAKKRKRVAKKKK